MTPVSILKQCTLGLMFAYLENDLCILVCLSVESDHVELFVIVYLTANLVLLYIHNFKFVSLMFYIS